MATVIVSVLAAAALAHAAPSIRSDPTPVVVGSNPCTYGPSYWCASKKNAANCDFPLAGCAKYCANPEEYPDIQNGEICSAAIPNKRVGTDDCTQGPSYWCASMDNARECGVPVKSCSKYCANTNEYASIQDGDICSPPAGADQCTWGPSFWCASVANAAQCGFQPAECLSFCANTNEYPSLENSTLCAALPSHVGTDNCTHGPSYWCASKANAEQCGVNVADCYVYCDANNTDSFFNASASDICNPVGANPCTWGPSFWCASTANAAQCNMTVDACEAYCNNTNEYPSLAKGNVCGSEVVVGNRACTWGPSYWCQSEANAALCDVATSACLSYCANANDYNLQDSEICANLTVTADKE
eukprot:comp21962_c1_seq1/m.31686 comp21962_c1_seq1/g.31686  ORF comp21962_c1_seq1/g.31686 comp21962_c1_seq1/m.31686 type:complete len:359 (-) comp21962_c1_seq1:388-1464(-)